MNTKIKQLLKEQEEELERIIGDINAADSFIGGREKTENTIYMNFIGRWNAKIIKAVCEEMK